MPAQVASAPQEPGVGRLIAGRYRLLAKLGHGGMGTVWRAKDETVDREVAVKEPRVPDHLPERERANAFERMRREARAAARLDHPSVVNVHDVAVVDGQPWIVMELIHGRSLGGALEEGTLGVREAARIGLEVLGALEAAHAAGILHRDVKPDNVLLGRHDRVVLTDFGIAQVEGDPSITSTGMLVGAPSYISPERARGHKPGPAADLWSLGGLLYAAVEGTPPYDKGSAIATLTAVMTEPLDEPKNAGPLRDVIYGLLTKDPVRRLDDAGARAKLNAVLHAPDRRETEAADATKVVPLPMQPDGPGSRAGSSASSSGGSSGGEAAEKLRGALRSVRKAAVAAGAATSAAAGRAKSSNAPGVSGGSGASGASRSLGTQEETRGGAATGAVTSAAAVAATKAEGTAAAKATTTAASASVPVSRSATGAAPGQGGANGGPAPRSSGWPVMTPPDLPPRPVPRAPLTDVVPKRTLVIIAVVVALAVLGTVLALTLGGGEDDPDGAKSGGGSQAVASDSAAADTKDDEDSGARADGSAPESAASGSASGSSSPSSTAAAGGAGSGTSGSGAGAAVTTHTSKQGYKIGLPAGWKYQSTSAAGDRFTGPDGQKLLIGWTTTPKDDPVADWENQERSMKRSQYKRVRIEKVDYRGWNTADWEFTYSESGTAYRTIDRGFVVNGHLGHALMHTAKSAAWDGDLRVSTWETFTKTFTPKA
ncbi:serine/threonine-protein kinase [Streptomyces bobili]|uniref:serine/threonine-protein kinase n=1 Tax=Streptomyces bobili TaxID=67280 RepID=UPI000A38B4B0|nr:serine/threonine-protein kinase [Streptomyces bobili]